jgi:hypothetical protein
MRRRDIVELELSLVPTDSLTVRAAGLTGLKDRLAISAAEILS